MVAALNDLPVLQHHDRIGVADCRKPVGDDKGCPVRHQPVHAVLDVLLRPRIDRTRRLIQNQDLRLWYQRAGNRQALALAAGEVAARRLHRRIQHAGFAADK